MAYRQDLFAFTLGQLRGGKVQEELSAALNQLIQDCGNVQAKGSLSIELTVRPDKGDSGQYFLRLDHKVKSPKFAQSDTLFWGTPEGNLQRTDPSQGDLDLRVVPDAPKQIKTVDDPLANVKQIS